MVTKTVFVGSTFVDLESHRALVRNSITRLDQNSKAMEFFGALPDTPKEECLRLVRLADIYVGIFAMRYGYIDTDSGKSLTQLEYEEAQALHLPSLIYLIDEDRHAVLPKHVDTGDAAERLRQLKDTLRQRHVVNLYSSPDDLAAKVTQDLVRLISASGTASTPQVLSQIASNQVKRHPLTAPRYKFLRTKCAEIFPHDVPDAILREAMELVLAGERLSAALVLSRGTPMNLRDAIDGLMGFDLVMEEIMAKYSDPDS